MVILSLASLVRAQVCKDSFRTQKTVQELADLYAEVQKSKSQPGTISSLLEKAFQQKFADLVAATGMTENEIMAQVVRHKQQSEAKQKKKPAEPIRYKLEQLIEASTQGDDPRLQETKYLQHEDVLMVPSYQGVQLYKPKAGLSDSFIINTGFDYFYEPGSGHLVLKSKSFSGSQTSYRVVRLSDFEEVHHDFSYGYIKAQGRLLVMDPRNSIQILDLHTGTFILQKKLPDFDAATLSPDGKTLFYQKNAKLGVLFDIDSQKEVGTIKISQKIAPVRFMTSQFSPDGQYLILLNHGNTAIVEMSTGKTIVMREGSYFRGFTEDGKGAKFDNGIFKLPKPVVVPTETPDSYKKNVEVEKLKVVAQEDSSMIVARDGSLIGVIESQEVYKVPNSPYIFATTPDNGLLIFGVNR